MNAIRYALLALVPLSGPAWAGCDDYSATEAPRASICFDGACEETLAAYQCGNIDGAQYGYANGLRVELAADGSAVAYRDKAKVDMASITCVEIDKGSCFPTR